MAAPLFTHHEKHAIARASEKNGVPETAKLYKLSQQQVYSIRSWDKRNSKAQRANGRSKSGHVKSKHKPGYRVPDEKKAQILRDAEATSVPEAAEKHGISDGAIYKWRNKASASAPKSAPKKRNGKPKAAVSRIQRTDEQKRLILRVARDTTPTEAAKKFNISTSQIYKWRQAGLRASRKPSSSAKANRTKAAKRAKTQTVPAVGGAPENPIAFPMDPKVGTLAQEVDMLRQQVGTAFDENQRLRDLVVDLMLKVQAKDHN